MKSEEMKELPDLYRVINIAKLEGLIHDLKFCVHGEILKPEIKLIAKRLTDLLYEMPRIPSLPAGEDDSFHEKPTHKWYPPHLTISQPVMELIIMIEKRRLMEGVIIDFGTKQETWEQFRDYIVAMDAGIQMQNKKLINELVEAIERSLTDKIRIQGEDLVKLLNKSFFYQSNKTPPSPPDQPMPKTQGL